MTVHLRKTSASILVYSRCAHRRTSFLPGCLVVRPFANIGSWREMRLDRGLVACQEAGRELRAHDAHFIAKQGKNPDQKWATRRMHNLAKQGKWRDAINVLREIRDPDGISYATAIFACAKAGKAGIPQASQQALDLFEEMPERNPEAFTALIDMHGRQGNLKDVLSLWDRMQLEKVLPTTATYGAMVNAFAMRCRPEEADEWFQNIRNVGLRPDEACFTSVMSAWSKVGNYAKARGHFVDMIHTCLRPDMPHYTVLITACIQPRDHDTATALMEQLRQQGLKPGVVEYTAALKACRNDFRTVQALQRQMQEAGVGLNEFAHDALLDACDFHGSRAQDLKNQVQQMPWKAKPRASQFECSLDDTGGHAVPAQVSV